MTLNGPQKLPLSGDAPTSLVILLHGIGADGNDLISLADEFAADLPDTLFIAPDAPTRYAMNGFQWFALYDTTAEMMLQGIDEAAKTVNGFIDAKIAELGLKPSRVAIIGFSQGTMTGLHAALRRRQAIGGVVGYSGMLLAKDADPAEVTSRPPVCLIHGSVDPVVPFALMADAEAALLTAGIEVESHIRPGLGHGIDMQGIKQGLEFLKKRLA